MDKHIHINNNILNAEELETEVTKLTQAITHAKHKHTHRKRISTTRDNLPQHILDIIKQKNRLRKQWQTTRDLHTKTQMTLMNRQVKSEISTHLNSTWQTKLESLHPQDNSLWKIAKALRKPHKPIPTLEHNNTHATSDKDKAEILANTFEQIHNTNTVDTDEHKHIENTVDTFLTKQYPLTPQQRKKLLTKPSEIAQIAKTLPNNKAPGHDNIDNLILKNLSKKTYTQITYIINTIFTLQQIPKQWKIAYIIPILNPNKNPNLPNSYRPISLLPKLAKLTKKIDH